MMSCVSDAIPGIKGYRTNKTQARGFHPRVHVCVCVCANMHTCVHTCMCICTYMFVHVCKQPCVHGHGCGRDTNNEEVNKDNFREIQVLLWAQGSETRGWVELCV